MSRDNVVAFQSLEGEEDPLTELLHTGALNFCFPTD